MIIDRQDEEKAAPRVDELARALAAEINRADPGARSEMRDLAIDLLKDSVEPRGEARGEDGTAEGASGASLNPFALGIPLLLVGPLLGFLFPPVGLILLGVGAMACLVGLVLAMGRSLGQRWRGRGGEG